MHQKHNVKNIRNFSIIAHIDHGKSTIADRLLESTSTVEQREMREQLLDSMDLERERGITIKAHPVTMTYEYQGETYELNLIDTPGHVDFSYEVSRSLAACEGALLIVDAAQGVQAQSLANVYLALERDLEIIPILNKIDLPAADPERIRQQIEDYIGLDTTNAIACSAKTGQGISEILEAIINLIPPPKEPEDTVLKALVFDSHYNPYVGIMVYVRIISGELKKGDRVMFMSSRKATFEVLGVGAFLPEATLIEGSLRPGQVGYFIANIKKVKDVKIGDTVTTEKHPAKEPLDGFKEISPVVFAGIYPTDSSDFDSLKDALGRLQLNDSALTIEQESSHSLGFGFRCGFLGLLHLEIIFERIIREFDLDIIATAPSVIYKVVMKNGKILHIDNPAGYPDPANIEHVEEPWVHVNIISPQEYLSSIMNLCLEKRGVCLKTEMLDHHRLVLSYDLPLNEIVSDFNDKLKSVTKGYGSFDYRLGDYRKSPIIKLEILINDEPVDAFSCLVHRDKAEAQGRKICEKLVDVIPQQLFKIPIQAAINKKIIARETIRALSKNVTAKCYGGDITRKRKLWEKQKKGKKRMKEFGKVSIPNTAFIEVLKLD
ncbi:GTP-binding protein LepA [Chlamydia pecorum MC/MarsBar]|uniref:translation elongation factor 4 n=1 Tax=Chlamydia pecorum TaxID=85991 RepID=UPI0003D3D3B6|nr:translation elongation factor 4 [Chlamydia pecorum]ETF37995.1 GTP-binding protein LepA [Chlamydia pecorum DBDeUG]ETF38263.1 GTP-binding protein LepA [Chlamydia pecorum MC/MarsBar]UBV32248.1 GTP-binding protein LepA [Chlamydia pecorum]UBV33195.1 GTP-binding protein LepA [Chlamydia pecorum]